MRSNIYHSACRLLASAGLLIALQLAPAAAEIRLFKDIPAGDTYKRMAAREGYYDCTEDGVQALCLADQTFQDSAGGVAVIFDKGFSSRVVFASEGLNLFNNAVTTFSDGSYALVGIGTKAGMFDFVSMLKANGYEAAIARFTEIEQVGLTENELTYYFYEAEAEKLSAHANMLEFGNSLPSGKRFIMLSLTEDDDGTMSAVIFGLNHRDSEALAKVIRSTLAEDF